MENWVWWQGLPPAQGRQEGGEHYVGDSYAMSSDDDDSYAMSSDDDDSYTVASEGGKTASRRGWWEGLDKGGGEGAKGPL